MGRHQRRDRTVRRARDDSDGRDDTGHERRDEDDEDERDPRPRERAPAGSRAHAADEQRGDGSETVNDSRADEEDRRQAQERAHPQTIRVSACGLGETKKRSAKLKSTKGKARAFPFVL
jgi:hypothetical protein